MPKQVADKTTKQQNITNSYSYVQTRKSLHLLKRHNKKDDSVDCGVVVVYLIKKLFEQQPIIKDEVESEIPAMRTEIVKTFLHWGTTKKKNLSGNFFRIMKL
ncbi:hypothetical protein ABFS83_06G200700 [Erythranthe nasuta]